MHVFDNWPDGGHATYLNSRSGMGAFAHTEPTLRLDSLKLGSPDLGNLEVVSKLLNHFVLEELVGFPRSV